MSRQIDKNNALGENAIEIFFVNGKNLPTTKTDPYFSSRPKEKMHAEAEIVLESKTNKIKTKKNNKLIFHIDCVTDTQQLCILPKAAAEIIAITHENGHPGFNKCYKTIVKSWYVKKLVKQLQLYIKHYLQCLVLQTRQHQLYRLL